MILIQPLLNALKGFLIGVAEVIPGVSGGTIALVVGIYERVLAQAALVAQAFAAAISSPKKTMRDISRLDFKFLLPVLFGMVLAIVLGAAVLEPMIASEPEITLGLFAGLITASLIVPFRMISGWNWALVGAGLLGAVFAFGLTSLPRTASQEPALWVVFIAAALAVCALVLPGVSGSFFLLAIGLYQPTIAAVNDRDFLYLGIFALGALIGLFSFSVFMQHLLLRHRNLTLAVMTGLMLGSLRALWPWQTGSGGLLAPADPFGPVGAFLVGLFVVSALIVWQARLKPQSSQ